jgi:GNAT superfamily N-acetyltransferase
MKIIPMSELPRPKPLLDAAETVFFESSSKKNFTDPEEKKRFLQRYFGIYAEQDPSHFLLAVEGDDLLGYLAGTPSTREEHLELNPYLQAFRAELGLYPAHLHINFTSRARGLGLGSLLVRRFEEILQREAVPGVHIVTGALERNVGFYMKNGYEEVALTDWNGAKLMMLGHRL